MDVKTSKRSAIEFLCISTIAADRQSQIAQSTCEWIDILPYVVSVPIVKNKQRAPLFSLKYSVDLILLSLTSGHEELDRGRRLLNF